MIPISIADVVRTRRPLVNFALIAINLVVFLYVLSLSDFDTFRFTYKFGLIPAELSKGIEFSTFGGPTGPDIASPIPTWGTVFTSMFMHGGWLHILGNMMFLWGFGDKVEEKLGHVKYLLFYFGAGVAAVWTQVAIDLDSQVVLIGASGAIFGVLGAYLLAYPYSRVVGLLLVFLILPLFYNVGSVGPDIITGRVAYMAHVGGFAAGVLLMGGYKFLLREPILPRRRFRPWEC